MRMPSGTRRWAVLGWALLALALVGAAAHARSRRAADTSRPVPQLLPAGLGMVRRSGPRRADRARGAAVSHHVLGRAHGHAAASAAPTYEAQLQDLLRFKYAGRPIDAIVAADDAALTFLLDAPRRAVPGRARRVPGHQQRGARRERRPAQLHRAAARNFRTGRHRQSGDDAAAGHTTDRGGRRCDVDGGGPARRVPAVARRRPDLTVHLSRWRAACRSSRFVDAAARTTSATDAVVTTAFTRDVSGRYYPRDEALAQIAAASRAPVYSAAVSRLGQGLLAGSENGGFRYASRAARDARGRAEWHEGLSDIPREGDDLPAFRHRLRAGRAVGHSRVELPPTAIFVNRPASFYQTNRTAIWGALLFMLLQAAVIGALVVNIGRRRRAEQALAAQADHLAASNADLERLNLSLRSEMSERRQAEDQLRQAQKIDAIGRLAGGVAHDFNNLLTVIGSYADILLETLDRRRTPARPHAEQIRQATERAIGPDAPAAGVQPQAGDAAARRRSQRGRARPRADARPPDRRGHRAPVRLEPSAPATVVVDAGQIEQVIVNLAVNGRDAMPRRRAAADRDASHGARRRADRAIVRGWLPAPTCSWPCPTAARAWAPRRRRASSSRSSRPRGPARAPDLACRWPTASSSRAAAGSGSTARWGRGRPSRSTCPLPTRRRRRGPRPSHARPGPRPARRCCWSRTRPTSAR